MKYNLHAKQPNDSLHLAEDIFVPMGMNEYFINLNCIQINDHIIAPNDLFVLFYGDRNGELKLRMVSFIDARYSESKLSLILEDLFTSKVFKVEHDFSVEKNNWMLVDGENMKYAKKTVENMMVTDYCHNG
jgi:hypothetical protein